MLKIFFIMSALLVTQSYAAPVEKTITIKTRPGVTVTFLYAEPKDPVASAILFAGYDGYLNIGSQGIGKPSTNFLVRARQQFTRQRLAVAVVDSPSDRKGMLDWRTSKEHASDIKTLINWLRARVKKPVWLVGTSRGTISAASVAARLENEGPDGIVLTATVTVAGGQNSGNIKQTKLNKIKVPTLIVHHRLDGCYVTPYKGAYELVRKFGNAKTVGFLAVRGGKSRGTDECGGLTEHGFSGIENQVVRSIAAWIRSQ